MTNVVSISCKQAQSTRRLQFAARIIELRSFMDELAEFIDHEDNLPPHELISLQKLLLDCCEALDKRSPEAIRSVIARKDLFSQFQNQQSR